MNVTKNSVCLMVDCLSRPLGNQNFPVRVMSRAPKSLYVNLAGETATCCALKSLDEMINKDKLLTREL